MSSRIALPSVHHIIKHAYKMVNFKSTKRTHLWTSCRQYFISFISFHLNIYYIFSSLLEALSFLPPSCLSVCYSRFRLPAALLLDTAVVLEAYYLASCSPFYDEDVDGDDYYCFYSFFIRFITNGFIVLFSCKNLIFIKCFMSMVCAHFVHVCEYGVEHFQEMNNKFVYVRALLHCNITWCGTTKCKINRKVKPLYLTNNSNCSAHSLDHL